MRSVPQGGDRGLRRPAWIAPALLILSSSCAPKSSDVVGRGYMGRAAERAQADPLTYLPNSIVRIAPYEGDHPRASRRNDCIDPRNDHKLRVELPWPGAGYVVVDLPEALYAGDQRLFVAHSIARDPSNLKFAALPTVRWRVHSDGRMNYYRTLPGGVAFSALAIGRRGYVDLVLTVANHSDADLFGVRAEVCVLLARAVGFASTTRANKYCIVEDRFVSVLTAAGRRSGVGRFDLRLRGHDRRADAPIVAARSQDGRRSILTVWEPCHGLPTSAANPCMHSDPLLGDCPAGTQVTVRGRVYFIEGDPDGFRRALQAGGSTLLPVLAE